MIKKHGIIGLIIVLLFGGGYAVNELGGGGPATRLCDVSTVVASSIGTTSVTVLAASGLRAWAIIEQPPQASSTVSLSFDEGADAVAFDGISLSTTTPQMSFITFGLGTDFAYTGAVTAIVEDTGVVTAGNASTTVRITQCNYR